MTEQRRLAAIVSADVAGYSRLMGRDETGTLAALRAIRQEVVDPAIAAHGGRIVKSIGDGLLLEFPSVVNAVRCAVEVQKAMTDRTATLTIIRTCLNGGRPDLIEDALFDRLSVSDLRAKIEAERPAPPAQAATPAASRSILGGEPTPEQRDALAAALQRRFQQMYPKPAQ